MFAKLKKKIQDEGSGMQGGSPEIDVRSARLTSPGPGIASPVKMDFTGASPLKRESVRDIETMSVSSEISDVKDTASKEDMLKKILKKNDQIKKLEGKITDLAAMVKDRNKTIEKLEQNLQKQKEENEAKLQEMLAKFEKEKEKLLEDNSDELSKKIKVLEKNKKDLEKQLQEAEEYKKKFLKQEEERDEFDGLTTQEMAKVKHMLLNTQEELQTTQTQLSERTKQFEVADKQVKELNSEVQSLMQQISELTSRSEDLEDENKNNKAMLEQLQGVQNEISHKSGELKSAREALDQLQHKHEVLQRNSDMHQNKMSKLVEEKDEHISHLRERVQTLEQRLQHGELSGDDRIKALEQERFTLEQKLTETREQLSQVKSSWSDKISHLETQIAHLNTKIAEDNEDIMAKQKEIENLKEHFHKQAQDLQSRLETAEKNYHTQLDISASKDTDMEKLKNEHKSEILREKLHWTSLETELREKVTDLHKDIDSLHKTREHDKQAAQQKISKLETAQAEWLEKEIDMEKQVTSMEDKVTALKQEVEVKERLIGQGDKKDDVIAEKEKEIEELKQSIEPLKTKIKDLEKELADLDKEFQTCSEEKDSLLLRNAQLSQEYESFKRKTKDREGDLETELQQKNNSIAGIEQVLQDMQTEMEQYKQKIHELEDHQLVAITEIESEEIKKLQKEVKELEDQLIDRNRTIKKLQQRMSDLKKTLQRELNVQALPNDQDLDPPKDISRTTNGLHTQGHIKGALVHNHSVHNSESHSSGDTLASLPVSSNMTVSVDRSKFYAGASDFSASDLENLPSNTVNKTKSSSSSRPGYTNNYAGVQYDRDINFDYLKHVVLKFMLSRESEAIHLVRAVAVLLDFTNDEQKLIKDTLEYKMSWFGSKPRLGQGQYSKYIPPSM